MNSPADTRDRTDARLDRETEERLDRVWKRAYEARSREDLKRLYADWADTYDADHEAIGFFGHRLAAEVLARNLTRLDTASVLDAGAGTGAAGVALAELGVRDLVGTDLSEEMLERARDKGVYRDTVVADLGLPLDAFAPASFDAAILVGVFSYGQAPPEALDELVRVVRPGGVLVLTMRTDFFENDAMGIRSRLRTLERSGTLALVEQTEPAPYLPEKDPEAAFRVWCFRVMEAPSVEVEEGFEDAIREALEARGNVVEIDHAWIWDSRASRLYDRYTNTSGYYLTDCEEQILRDDAEEIAGDEPLLVELGCGSARKILHLLRQRASAETEPLRYMPIDVSPGALRATARSVTSELGERIAVEPRQGLFDEVLSELPAGRRKAVFFFGSSIGNLESLEETVAFLRSLRAKLRPGDRLVIGTDLHKDADVLERAYNEEEACRSFFVHMLRRVNEHLGADFDPRVFELASTYVEEPEFHGIRTHRMNLRVAPAVPQHTGVRDLNMEVQLPAGHPIQVGISRKFQPRDLRALGRLAGLRLERQWLDDHGWFALSELVPAPDADRGE